MSRRPHLGSTTRRPTDLTVYTRSSTCHAAIKPNTPRRSKTAQPSPAMAYLSSVTAYSTVLLASLFAGYILFTGSGTQFNPGAFLEQTSPYVWALTGMGLNIGLSVAGAGWYSPVSPLSRTP